MVINALHVILGKVVQRCTFFKILAYDKGADYLSLECRHEVCHSKSAIRSIIATMLPERLRPTTVSATT